jgi:hypothetical protein
VNLVIEKLTKRPARKARKAVVRQKHLRDLQGRTVRVLSLDANSATFADDLTLLFERNVAKARRENKRLLGSADGVPAEKK